MNSTKDIDNLTFGTESQYSGVSNNQSGGDLFASLFGGSDKGSYATELALDAYCNRNPNVGCYAIKNALRNSYNLDYSAKSTGSKTSTP